jgi:hypothetical protein
VNKRDVLRFKLGEKIRFGNSMWSEKVCRHGKWQTGTVLYVTENGGIRVRLHDDDENLTNELGWVPYHHVLECYSRR